jgi:DNA (cytosine-5)-methyltransferase 1
MIKYSDIRNDEDVFIREDSDSQALFTHFLQNKDSKINRHYQSRLNNFFPGLVKTYTKEKINWNIPFPPNPNPKFTFIDLFAGIGGMRLAFQSLGGKCVFTSEWDASAQKTYETNFGEVPFGDITKINEKDVPNHDVLVAGFPCQAFSIAGRRDGFEDTRGTLFFDVARIIREKKPKAFFLENVKGLASHDGGRTLKVILKVLRDDLNYYVPEHQFMNAKYFGVPQNRERIFIVGFRKDILQDGFLYPKQEKITAVFNDVKEKKPVSQKYYLSNRYWDTLKKHKARHALKGNGFGYEIIKDNQISNAIVVGGMGRERNLVIDNRIKDFTPVTNIKGEINREGIRKMTPREWARLQGFPDNFIIPVSDAQAYRQFGNAVAIPAIRATAKKVIDLVFKENKDVKRKGSSPILGKPLQ